MIDKIKDKLSKQKVDGWQIREITQTSHQSFLAKTERDCTRQVESKAYSVTIHQLRENSKILGISKFNLSPKDESILEHKIEDALVAASLVTNQPFQLPEKPASLPTVEIKDNKANQASLVDFETRVMDAVDKEKNTRLSSTEFFINQFQTRLVNHLGLDVSQDETILHMELILLSKSKERENEFITRYTRRFIKDFDIEEKVHQAATYAREATQARLPRTGTFPVVLSEEPMENLFNPLLAKASARLQYNKMISSVVGQSILNKGNPKGDPLTLWSNGLEKGLLGTGRFDSYGFPTNRTRLVNNNILETYLSDSRYGSYLNVPITGELGNLEVEAGSKPFNDLLQSTNGPIYHLTAFSAFEPNSITGAFSAEIRSGYEITSKGIRPIKGGSVSGLLHKDLLNCYLAKEMTQRERVLVPQGIRFEALNLAGS